LGCVRAQCVITATVSIFVAVLHSEAGMFDVGWGTEINIVRRHAHPTRHTCSELLPHPPVLSSVLSVHLALSLRRASFYPARAYHSCSCFDPRYRTTDFGKVRRWHIAVGKTSANSHTLAAVRRPRPSGVLDVTRERLGQADSFLRSQ
jgi:hypothetical protein